MKYIFQTWKRSDLEGANPIFQLSQNSWKHFHPSWEYEFFDDNALENSVRSAAPIFYKKYFKKHNGQIKKVDLFRYVNLFQRGGVYSDLDGECIQSFESTILETREDHLIGALKNETSPNRYPNALMISKNPLGNFWIYVLAHSIKRFENDRGYYSTEYLTGPMLLTEAIVMYQKSTLKEILYFINRYFPDQLVYNTERKETINLLSYKQVYPIDWHSHSAEIRKKIGSNRISTGKIPFELIYPETVYINYWTYSWTKPFTPLSQKIFLRFRYYYFRLRRFIKY